MWRNHTSDTHLSHTRDGYASRLDPVLEHFKLMSPIEN